MHTAVTVRYQCKHFVAKKYGNCGPRDTEVDIDFGDGAISPCTRGDAGRSLAVDKMETGEHRQSTPRRGHLRGRGMAVLDGRLHLSPLDPRRPLGLFNERRRPEASSSPPAGNGTLLRTRPRGDGERARDARPIGRTESSRLASRGERSSPNVGQSTVLT